MTRTKKKYKKQYILYIYKTCHVLKLQIYHFAGVTPTEISNMEIIQNKGLLGKTIGNYVYTFIFLFKSVNPSGLTSVCLPLSSNISEMDTRVSFGIHTIKTCNKYQFDHVNTWF